MYKYHLSYDRKHEESDSNQLLKELIEFISEELQARNLERHLESTLIFESLFEFNKIEKFFISRFATKAFFVFSLIGVTRNSKNQYFSKISINSNKELDNNFKRKLI